MPQSCSSLAEFIHQLPKTELHVHLEGSVEPETLRELALAKGRLRAETEACIAAQASRRFRYGSFQEFLRCFKLTVLLLESPADYALATTRLAEQLARQNVRYAEVTFSAGVVLWKQQPLEAIFSAMAAAARECEARLAVRLRWIFDAVRQFGTGHARDVLHWAYAFRAKGVVAFGIGGDEQKGPAELFRSVYAEAGEMGLRLTAHAGETAGPESIRKAVDLLGAERIGHGLTAAQDPGLMELLARRGIPLEVCLSSNVATGLIASARDHPLRQFLDAGVVVTLNSDDPALFGTSLESELALAAAEFHLKRDEVARICRSAIEASFMPEAERQQSLGEFDAAALIPHGDS